MAESTPFNALLMNWKRYYSLHVKQNEHLILPLFHVVCSVPLRDCGLFFMGRRNNIKVNLGVFQTSGTGKGMALKSGFFMAKAVSERFNFRDRPRYTTNDTEATAVGTVYKNQPVNGYLSHTNYYAWDEGEVLIRPGQYNTQLRKYLNLALDGESWVRKGVGGQNIEYHSPSVLTFATYISDALTADIFVEGFFQRFLLSYKKITTSQFQKMIDEVIKDESNLITNAESEDLKHDFCDICGQFVFKKTHLALTKDARELASDSLNTMFNEKIIDYFSGQKKEDLQSFYARFPELCYKIATQHAILSCNNEITPNDIKYALVLVEDHLSSSTSLLNISAKEIKRKEKSYSQAVISLLEKKPIISQSDLIDELKILKNKGQWDLGRNSTLKLLDQFEDDEIIYSVKPSQRINGLSRNIKLYTLREVSEDELLRKFGKAK